jgi:hypothetical protein
MKIIFFPSIAIDSFGLKSKLSVTYPITKLQLLHGLRRQVLRREASLASAALERWLYTNVHICFAVTHTFALTGRRAWSEKSLEEILCVRAIKPT